MTNTTGTLPIGRAEKTPLERMADLTRRVVAVPKVEVVKAKPKKRKRH